MNNLRAIKLKPRNKPASWYLRSPINKTLNTGVRKKHVAMFHAGRCGSTVLGNMLNAHSKIFWANEIFNTFARPDGSKVPDKYLESVINNSRNRRISNTYGFETKYLPQQHLSSSCLNISLSEYVKSLRALGFGYFISLHRKNYLRRAISAQIGREHRQWHVKEKTLPTKVTIDIDSFQTGMRIEPLIDLFSSMDESYERLRDCLPANSLFLNYEDSIQDDPILAYTLVCDYLGLEHEKPKIELRRTNPFSFEQMVSNFDEVKSALMDTKYSWMLDD